MVGDNVIYCPIMRREPRERWTIISDDGYDWRPLRCRVRKLDCHSNIPSITGNYLSLFCIGTLHDDEDQMEPSCNLGGKTRESANPPHQVDASGWGLTCCRHSFLAGIATGASQLPDRVRRVDQT